MPSEGCFPRQSSLRITRKCPWYIAIVLLGSLKKTGRVSTFSRWAFSLAFGLPVPDSCLQRVEQVLGHSVSEDVCIVHVRSVAPGKEMYCISFRLPREVALGEVAES